MIIPIITLPLTINDHGHVVQPLHILDSRTIIGQSHLIAQVLIQWDSLDLITATWDLLCNNDLKKVISL